MAHDHDDYHHDHGQDPPSDMALRVKALESLLVDKGIVDPAALDVIIETYEHKVGPRNGARVVARAWSDPAYRARLMADATTAIAELGFAVDPGEALGILDDFVTLGGHLVPWPVLGLPPVWYKAAPYRSRAVIDPRGVMAEFGTRVADDVEVRVWDSTAEIRYLVVPQRSAGTDGLTEDQLADLVTRDSMIGVARL